MLKDLDVPQRLSKNVRPCGSLIRDYVGHAITNRPRELTPGIPGPAVKVQDANGWFTLMWIDKMATWNLRRMGMTPYTTTGIKRLSWWFRWKAPKTSKTKRNISRRTKIL
jgi:hypothetical protein